MVNLASGCHPRANREYRDGTLSIVTDREGEKEKIESHIIHGHGA